MFVISSIRDVILGANNSISLALGPRRITTVVSCPLITIVRRVGKSSRCLSTFRMILVQSLKYGSRDMLQLPPRWEGNLIPQCLLGRPPCNFVHPRIPVPSCDGKKSKWLLFCITWGLQHLADPTPSIIYLSDNSKTTCICSMVSKTGVHRGSHHVSNFSRAHQHRRFGRFPLSRALEARRTCRGKKLDASDNNSL